jgi:hypothetical protein
MLAVGDNLGWVSGPQAKLNYQSGLKEGASIAHDLATIG